jgi:hypothetical protein
VAFTIEGKTMAQPESFHQAARPDGVQSANAVAAMCWIVAMAAYFALQESRLLEVWNSGSFFDTDDAMRMVQVRDLMAGQGWYDMTAWRLDPPQGMFSHWSRIVDAPLTALIWFFRRFLDGVLAERAARIAFPALLAAGLFAAGLYAARIFAGAAMRLYGVAAMLFCGVLFWQFTPGRIDHHAPQILALLVAIAAMARCFGETRTGNAAALSGAMTALSLAIGLENLPFLALVVAAPMALYILRGAEARDTLNGYALGLSVTLVLLFAATVAPNRWAISACDALSGPYVLAALAGCAMYALVARFGNFVPSPFTEHMLARCGLAGLCALGAAAPLALLMPLACLADPFYGIDPLVRRLWLDPNPEVISIVEQWRRDPNLALLLGASLLLGLAGAVFGALGSAGAPRVRWLWLALHIALGGVIGALHLRVFSTVMPLVALGLLAPVSALRDAVARSVSPSSRALISNISASLALFFLSNFGLIVMLPDVSALGGAAAASTAAKGVSPCFASASYEKLAELPPGLAVSTISPGAYLLAHTDLSVLAGPYHRDNHGNRAVLDILSAPPALAEKLTRKAGARYVILCWARPGDVAILKAMGADGLGVQLSQGLVPGWLRPVKIDNTPFHVYEVAAPSD